MRVMTMTDAMQDRDSSINRMTMVAIVRASLWSAAMTALGMAVALIVLGGR